MFFILAVRILAISMLTLPILCKVSVRSSAEYWHVKRWLNNPSKSHFDDRPENLSNRRRDLSEKVDLMREKHRVGVMKMTADEGQKFFHKYWIYEGDDYLDDSRDANLSKRDEYGNFSSVPMAPFIRPLLPSMFGSPQGSEERPDGVLERRNPAAVLAYLQKRDFQCPKGTADCSAIGHPNSCCPLSDVCFAIEDTGLGPVGCCRRGKKCGGTINNCNNSNTPCPSSLGGGCCLQNYVCGGVGCVINPTMVITTIITVTTMISSSSEIATITTTSIPPIPYTSGFQSCSTDSEANCTDKNTCTSVNNCNSPSIISTSALSIDPGDIPVRPTSLNSFPPSKSQDDQTCPLGFYACEAFYVGGCCRTGRNCDTTSCPPRTSTNLVGNSVTIQVPVGTDASLTRASGSCATGWASCALNEGGGCCPSGWKCGLTNCIDEKAMATTTISKESHSYATKKDIKIMNLVINLLLVVMGIMKIL
ncbi:hypothetical protein HI914_01185 [Erysiphe necator]|nr:hypothetical protein HI914_01185 [Erysiphe necator]